MEQIRRCWRAPWSLRLRACTSWGTTTTRGAASRDLNARCFNFPGRVLASTLRPAKCGCGTTAPSSLVIRSAPAEGEAHRKMTRLSAASTPCGPRPACIRMVHSWAPKSCSRLSTMCLRPHSRRCCTRTSTARCRSAPVCEWAHWPSSRRARTCLWHRRVRQAPRRPPERHLLHLPRLGARYDTETGELWVFGNGPFVTGDQVGAIGGEFAKGRDAPSCSYDHTWGTVHIKLVEDLP